MNAAAEDALVFLPEVRLFLAARCRDHDLAADLAQEVAARIVQAAPRLDGAQNLRGYLFRVAHNVWRDWLRRELVRRREAAVMAAAPERMAPAADSALLARELAEAARRAIDALPAAQKDVVLLRHQQNLTFQQIADRLGRPLGTVLGQMRTAMQRVHQAVEPYR
jgi:RNA polymerase sigma-70 factor (ECF subfamily)